MSLMVLTFLIQMNYFNELKINMYIILSKYNICIIFYI